MLLGGTNAIDFLIPLNNNFLQVLTVIETIIILQKNCKAHL
jgi:hypothetical protein